MESSPERVAAVKGGLKAGNTCTLFLTSFTATDEAEAETHFLIWRKKAALGFSCGKGRYRLRKH